jgi:hypothetical protein
MMDRASGLAADGGDFDAANPGAGTEANRKFITRSIKLILTCRQVFSNKRASTKRKMDQATQ